MATLAHCAYCFECLSASLEKRPPLSLRQIEQYWEKYNAVSDEENAALENVSDEEDEEDEGMEDAVDGRAQNSYKPAAISRLLAPSPSTASSSSVPSTVSASSAATEASSATSKSSSRSSFFSLPRRLRRQDKPASSADDHPLFVTWNTLTKSGSKNLRGCIGTFEPQELEDGLRSYALTSAFDDSRFLPITSRELPTLDCGVTLLTNFEPADDPMEWELGKHGLRISFTYHSRRFGATYLPDVPLEQGWTKEETMISLMRKAGWSGRKEDWRKVADLKVITYQGRKVSLDYREWREWRDWVEEQCHE